MHYSNFEIFISNYLLKIRNKIKGGEIKIVFFNTIGKINNINIVLQYKPSGIFYRNYFYI